MIKAVLFDLDGTLVDSAPDMVATLNFLRARRGLPAMQVSELRHFVSRGAPGLIKAGMPPCDNETRMLWESAFVDHYQQNSFIESRPFEGVESLLAQLVRNSVPWGIVTNKSELLGKPILEKTGWLTSVSTVVYGDTAARGKPHPDPVLAACESLGLKPENALMVGDDLRDVEAGRRAGCQTAFVLYGYAERESQIEIGMHTTLINTPVEILELLSESVKV